MKLLLSLLMVLVFCDGYTFAENPYLHEGSIGDTEKPTGDQESAQAFSYRPIERLTGETFIFLPTSKSLQKFGYQSCKAGKGQFGQSLSYSQVVGRIGKILLVENDGGIHRVMIKMLDNGQIYECSAYSGAIEGLGSIRDLDDARIKWKGKTIWYKYGKVSTYNAEDGSFREIKVRRLTKGLVTNVVAAWANDRPVRIVFKLETGEEGFEDVNPSGTNVGEFLRDIARFESVFFTDDPRKIYQWPEDVWVTIEEGKVSIGMTKDQVLLSWGKPKSLNATMTQSGKHEQWIYGDNNYLYFEGGIVTSISQ